MGKTGKGLVEFADSKVGTPYFYGCKMKVLTENYMQQMHKLYPSVVTNSYMITARARKQVGKVNVDCSGLIGAYREKQIGSAQLYSTAYARLSVSDYKSWANGVVCYRKGHCGVFKRVGNEFYVVEAKGLLYGTVVSKFDPKKWECGLTFKDMTYDYNENVIGNASWKKINPYVEPVRNLEVGCRGEDVKWLQWELCEAGFKSDIERAGGIDGVFGRITEKCVKAYQKSCSIKIDGIAGKATRKCLKND